MKNERTTDRQERIGGFSQSVLQKAKIFQGGVGATGNETIHNKALAGIGYMLVSDMDDIETSNLSRTVLFTKADIGQQKARLAADRAQAMNISDGKCDALSGDVCHVLGEGVIRHMDAVVGCFDNDQTRIFLQDICMKLGKPYIDTGIGSLDWNVFTSSGKPECACLMCTMSQEDENRALSRVRNSCDVTRKKAAKARKIPTIVTSASMVGAKAAEEAFRVLHHLKEPDGAFTRCYPPEYGVLHLYTAWNSKLMHHTYSVREECKHHDSYEAHGGVLETPLSAHMTLREVLQWVQSNYGHAYGLSIAKDCMCADRGFITSAYCEHCGKPIDVYKPQPVDDFDMLCDDCKKSGAQPDLLSGASLKLHFSLNDEERVLSMTLLELGIPLAHILEFYPLEDNDADSLYLELTADIKEVMPNLPNW